MRLLAEAAKNILLSDWAEEGQELLDEIFPDHQASANSGHAAKIAKKDKIINRQKKRYQNPGKGYENNKKRLDAIDDFIQETAKKLPSLHAAIELKKMFPQAKKVLIIGCRSDVEILAFEKLGFDTIGIDITENKYDKVLNLDARCIEEYFCKDQFDLVYAAHSLEHIENPTKVLKGIKKVAKHGAWIALPYDAVPSIHHPTIFEIMKDENFSPLHDKLARQEVIDSLVPNNIGCEEKLDATLGRVRDYFLHKDSEYYTTVMADFKELEDYEILHFESGTKFSKKEFVIVFEFKGDG